MWPAVAAAATLALAGWAGLGRRSRDNNSSSCCCCEDLVLMKKLFCLSAAAAAPAFQLLLLHPMLSAAGPMFSPHDCMAPVAHIRYYSDYHRPGLMILHLPLYVGIRWGNTFLAPSRDFVKFPLLQFPSYVSRESEEWDVHGRRRWRHRLLKLRRGKLTTAYRRKKIRGRNMEKSNESLHEFLPFLPELWHMRFSANGQRT